MDWSPRQLCTMANQAKGHTALRHFRLSLYRRRSLGKRGGDVVVKLLETFPALTSVVLDMGWFFVLLFFVFDG